MPSSRRDYPSSMYPECGSSYSRSRSSSLQRDKNSHYDDGDYARSRDPRHKSDKSERQSQSRDVHANNRDRYYDSPRDRRDNSNSKDNYTDRKNSTSRTRSNASTFERLLPHDFRPSHADPEARHHRRQKEKECEGFDWTPGVVLALIGATALFKAEKSLVRRRKKEYVE